MNALDLIRLSLADYIEAPADAIIPEAKLADLDVDSLTMAELIFDLEDKHGIKLPDDTARPQTVADLIGLIQPFLKDSTEIAA